MMGSFMGKVMPKRDSLDIRGVIYNICELFQNNNLDSFEELPEIETKQNFAIKFDETIPKSVISYG